MEFFKIGDEFVSEREITDVDEIDKLLSSTRVCRVALFDKNYPYIVPMCFGYNITGGNLELYFRCEEKGKKIDLIKENSHAAFEIDRLHEIAAADDPCGFAAHYHSITGVGTIEVVTGVYKITGLNLIIKKYVANPPEKLSEQTLNSVAVLKLTASEFCCKEYDQR